MRKFSFELVITLTIECRVTYSSNFEFHLVINKSQVLSNNNDKIIIEK